MNKSLEQVKQFHEVFDHRIGNINELEPLAVRQLRIKLLFEELQELAEASDCMETFDNLCDEVTYETKYPSKDGDNVNQIEELDALCDLQYVLNGKIITAGMHDIFDKNFDLVHQNNMAKAHTDSKEALTTAMVTPGNTKVVQHGDYHVVTNLHGKVIKPHNHVKVQLSLT